MTQTEAVEQSEFTPTDEQRQALDLFASGDPLVIEAGAGTGKTSTLELLSRSTPRTGCYVAFNKSIAVEAGRRFPLTVSSSTMHSLAWQALQERLNLWERKDAMGREPSWRVAVKLGVKSLTVQVTEPVPRPKTLQPSALGGHIMRALTRFCESGDPEPTVAHFPLLPGYDPPLGPYRNNDAIAMALLPALRRAWDDASSPTGHIVRFDHSHYLKVWSLSRPELPGEYVLIDEAQDSNGVMMAVYGAQGGRQMTTVGDAAQTIYEWRGSANSLDMFGGTRTLLTQSFRFGPAIANVANAILRHLRSPLQLSGTDALQSTVGHVEEPRAILCRTNSTSLNVVLEEQRRGRAVHLVGGGNEITRFVEAAGRLQAGQSPKHPELSCFESWAEVQEYVESDPAGGELRMLAKLVDDYGVQIILDALDGGVPERQADVVVSTAHRAKGREWETVRLAADFDAQMRNGDSDPHTLAPGEWRLLYVACTRAQHRLDITGCRAVRNLLGDR